MIYRSHIGICKTLVDGNWYKNPERMPRACSSQQRPDISLGGERQPEFEGRMTRLVVELAVVAALNADMYQIRSPSGDDGDGDGDVDLTEAGTS